MLWDCMIIKRHILITLANYLMFEKMCRKHQKSYRVPLKSVELDTKILFLDFVTGIIVISGEF